MVNIDVSTRNYLFGVGSRSDLLNEFSSKNKQYHPSWIANINYLGAKEKTLATLGKANVFYSTGDGFYPTADLIKNFRAEEYFLSFVFKYRDEGWVPSSSITW